MQPTKSRPKKSINRHPLFPVIAALWTGALLGLGSLATPGWMIERAVLASHVDKVLPAAAPPLGMTARLLLAMALFCAGALIGLMATRRRAAAAPVGAAVAERPRQAAADLLAELEPEGPAPRAFAEDGPRILDLNGLSGLEGLAPTSPKLERHDVPETLLGSLRFDTPADQDWHPASEDMLAVPAKEMIPVWAETLDNTGPLTEAPAAASFDPLQQADLPTAPAQSEAADDYSANDPSAHDFAAPAPGEPRPASLANATPLGLVSSDVAAKLKAAPLEALGVVELAERLALAISERRSRAAGNDPASAGLSFDGERPTAAARPRNGGSDGFGSLLDMTMPNRALRSEPAEDDAADWDDSAPAPAAGEMPLQSALAKLQQISSGA